MYPRRPSKFLLTLTVLLLVVQTACATASANPASLPNPGATTLPGATHPPTAQSIPNTGGQDIAPADAQSMLQSVVQHYQAVGRDQALQDFTDQVSPFNSSNLFVLCIDPNHNISALGGFPMLVGVSADQLSDSAGGAFGQLLWDVAGTIPRGSFPFQWKDPATDQKESKVLYYQGLGKDVCGVVANQP